MSNQAIAIDIDLTFEPSLEMDMSQTVSVFNLPSGAKPTKLIISHNNQSSSLVISKVMLMALDV